MVSTTLLPATRVTAIDAAIVWMYLVGLFASDFSERIVVGSFAWMPAFYLIVLGLIFVPFYLRAKTRTLPKFDVADGSAQHGQ